MYFIQSCSYDFCRLGRALLYVGLLVSEWLVKVARVPRLFELSLGIPEDSPKTSEVHKMASSC